MFPTSRARLTGEPGVAKAYAELTLDDKGGRFDLAVIWLFSEPVEKIEFRWEEVERVGRIRWFWLYPGVQITLRRGVVENNWRGLIYFFTWRKRHAFQILEDVAARGVEVDRAPKRFLFLRLEE